jgi:hypothetical protein
MGSDDGTSVGTGGRVPGGGVDVGTRGRVSDEDTGVPAAPAVIHKRPEWGEDNVMLDQ